MGRREQAIRGSVMPRRKWERAIADRDALGQPLTARLEDGDLGWFMSRSYDLARGVSSVSDPVPETLVTQGPSVGPGGPLLRSRITASNRTPPKASATMPAVRDQ